MLLKYFYLIIYRLSYMCVNYHDWLVLGGFSLGFRGIQFKRLIYWVEWFILLINQSISHLLANVEHNSTIYPSDKTTTGPRSFRPTYISYSIITFWLLRSTSDTNCWEGIGLEFLDIQLKILAYQVKWLIFFINSSISSLLANVEHNSIVGV